MRSSKRDTPQDRSSEGKRGLRELAPETAEVADFAQQEGEGAIFLTAGEQITVSPKTARKTLHPNLAGATSWTQRQLIFESASLAEVAEEFNRYNERKLVIDPSALDTLHISGVFSSTDPASLIRFPARHDRPGLRVTETPTEIRVEQDPRKYSHEAVTDCSRNALLRYEPTEKHRRRAYTSCSTGETQRVLVRITVHSHCHLYDHHRPIHGR